ncbi:MAG: sugar ABC transporter ATP-binding protein, partial [Propionibacteriaceae bacterium]
MASHVSAPLLEVTGVDRSYPGVHALADVDLALRPASITALLGENGAGKSTLIRVLAGVERPDAGTMTFDGRPYAPATPSEALRLGVSTLYQEQTLLVQRSVAANVLVGIESYRWGFFSDRARDRERTRV